MRLKLKTALFFSKCGKYGSAGGIVLTSISLLLMYNLNVPTTSGLLAMAFYLVNFYAYSWLTEYVEDRIKEETKK